MFSKRISILIALLILIIFITLVPLQAPVIRAFIMGLLTLVAFAFGRQIIVIYTLFLTGLVMVILDSKVLSTVSFQLSFAATLGVIISSKVKFRLNSKFLQIIIENIKISIAAQLFTFPIIMVHFKQISLVAPLTNLLISWTMEPILLFGFLGDLLGLIWRPFSYIPLSICQGLLIYFMSVVSLLQKIPFGFIDMQSRYVFGP
jgi:competence protein ComEC